MDVTEALLLLDPSLDEHWTSDGLPKVEFVAELVEGATRAMIAEAAPDFNREVARGEPVEEPKELSREEALAAELTEAQLEMSDVTKAQATLDAERKSLARRISYLGGQLDRVRSQMPVDNDITQYLASQNALRLERAAAMEELKESGVVQLLNSVGVSKLDAAMRVRKPARGSQRPAVRQPQN